MANPSTTHVIEIETGIGEPAFIPLTLGQELQPISVGKKGMWRIESPRVMDVHAFVYFDGSSLFLQSADDAAAASVDGYKIGKAWTELHAPCKIEIGTAKLRYRSLLPDGDSAATQVRPNAPVQGPPGGPPRTVAPQRPMPPPPDLGTPPPPMLSFPKAERPFKPGEFSQRVDDESTRIGPVAPRDGGQVRTGGSNLHPRPAAGRPPDEGDLSTRPDAAHVRGAVQTPGGQPMPMGVHASGPYAPIGAGPMQGAMMQGSMPPGMGGMGMGMGSMPPAMTGSMPVMAPQTPGYAGPMFPTGGYPQAGYPPMTPMGPGPGPMPGGPSLPPGGFGSMTPQGGSQAKPNPFEDFAEKWKAMSVPKRIAFVLFPIALLLGFITLFQDDPPPQPARKPRPDGGAAMAAADAGVVPPVMMSTGATTGGTAATQPQPTAWPKGVPCPPPNWPPNVPLPCVPDPTGTTTGGTTGAVDPPPPPPTSKKDAGAPTLTSSTRTLERQAVDAVAAGNKEQAAQIYEELSRRDPNNRVYAEAARILRAKLDAGAP
jgi:hypothetical protein